MTLGIGFVCNGGIVLAADSKVTTGTGQFDDDKIWYLRFPPDAEKPTLKVGIVCAGNLQFSVHAKEDLRRALQPDMGLDEVEHTLKAVLHDLHHEHIYPIGTHYERQDYNVWTLVGISACDGSRLLSSELTGVNPVRFYRSIGGRDDLVRMLVAQAGPEPPSVGDLVFPSSQILFNARKHVRDVGGKTTIIVLRDVEHDAGFVKDEDINHHESAIEKFDLAARPVLYGLSNRHVDDLEFMNHIEKFKGALMDVREIRKNIIFRVGEGRIVLEPLRLSAMGVIGTSQPPLPLVESAKSGDANKPPPA
jgi:hypothetical protein